MHTIFPEGKTMNVKSTRNMHKFAAHRAIFDFPGRSRLSLEAQVSATTFSWAHWERMEHSSAGVFLRVALPFRGAIMPVRLHLA